MMVDKAIVPIHTQSFVTPEKIPDEIEARLPRAANLCDADAPPRRGERLRSYGRMPYFLIDGPNVFERLTGPEVSSCRLPSAGEAEIAVERLF